MEPPSHFFSDVTIKLVSRVISAMRGPQWAFLYQYVGRSDILSMGLFDT
jgi:hypothetical protein